LFERRRRPAARLLLECRPIRGRPSLWQVPRLRAVEPRRRSVGGREGAAPPGLRLQVLEGRTGRPRRLTGRHLGGRLLRRLVVAADGAGVAPAAAPGCIPRPRPRAPRRAVRRGAGAPRPAPRPPPPPPLGVVSGGRPPPRPPRRPGGGGPPPATTPTNSPCSSAGPPRPARAPAGARSSASC